VLDWEERAAGNAACEGDPAPTQPLLDSCAIRSPPWPRKRPEIEFGSIVEQTSYWFSEAVRQPRHDTLSLLPLVDTESDPHIRPPANGTISLGVAIVATRPDDTIRALAGTSGARRYHENPYPAYVVKEGELHLSFKTCPLSV
jgi:hypothetical protein